MIIYIAVLSAKVVAAESLSKSPQYIVCEVSDSFFKIYICRVLNNVDPYILFSIKKSFTNSSTSATVVRLYDLTKQ